MSLVEWLASLMVVTMTMCSGRLVTPNYPGTTHYYTFWRAVNGDLVPRTLSLQTSVRNLILVNCSLDHAKRMFDDIELPSFPSNRTLERENRTSERPFLKSLLKETVVELYGYSRQLGKQWKIQCNADKRPAASPLCTRVTGLLGSVRSLGDDLKTQIHNYFQTSVDKLSKRSVVEKTLSSKRRRRKDKLAILMYGLYSHLHETLSALQFSLEFLKPHP